MNSSWALLKAFFRHVTISNPVVIFMRLFLTILLHFRPSFTFRTMVPHPSTVAAHLSKTTEIWKFPAKLQLSYLPKIRNLERNGRSYLYFQSVQFGTWYLHKCQVFSPKKINEIDLLLSQICGFCLFRLEFLFFRYLISLFIITIMFTREQTSCFLGGTNKHETTHFDCF